MTAPRRARLLESLGDDRAWLGVMAAVTAVEFIWWSINWGLGLAPLPWVATYMALAFAGLGTAVAARTALGHRAQRAGWLSLALGATLVGFGGSFFLPLKYAIPKAIPFWLDGPLASADRMLFGAEPWMLLDRLLGWAAVPMDRIYGLWLPVQSLVLFAVMSAPPGRRKSRALIAYCLAWLVLGVAAAAMFSSAGPIFYHRLFGGSEFEGLRETLRDRGAWMVLGESDAMWASLAGGRPGFVAGISAFPSLHVAISLWMVLAARSMAPRTRPLAICYCVIIAIASVQLGWHYISDGLAGALGMLAIWFGAGKLEQAIAHDAVNDR